MKKEKVSIERVYEKPIKVFNKQLKVTRVLLITSVFLIYCGTMFYETDQKAFLVLGLIPVTILILGFFLIQKRILYFGEHCLECSTAGDIYITKIKGICPRCKGELRIVKKSNDSIIQCQQNSEHTWNLDEQKGKKII